MLLVGGFRPFEKYLSNWIISPGRGENKQYLKPPPRLYNFHITLPYLTCYDLLHLGEVAHHFTTKKLHAELPVPHSVVHADDNVVHMVVHLVHTLVEVGLDNREDHLIEPQVFQSFLSD